VYLYIVVKVAFRSLLANKLRSCLAVLGIIIGVSAVIAMLAVAGGAQQQVLNRINSMGTDLLVVRPGQTGTAGVMSGSQQNLTLKDAEALGRETPGIFRVAPVVQGMAQVKYFDRNSSVTVMGVGDQYLDIRGFAIAYGRNFTADEANGMARVAVLGPTTATNLMDQEDAVGTIVKVKGINFKVVGVTKVKGDQGFFNPDDQVFIPHTTAMKQLFGLNYVREIDIQGRTGANLEALQTAASDLLRRRHRLEPEAANDFDIRNQAEMIATASSIGQTFSILAGSVAGISLLVGGIGIMNIMLVTVTERTREIGVRKAIGAKDRDILRQFLLESIVMSVLGGLIGVAVGVGVSKIVALATELTPVVKAQSVLISMSFSAAVGVFFGYYPARRAARLRPIDALRYE
jgi:putative ABC transport system permease protein